VLFYMVASMCAMFRSVLPAPRQSKEELSFWSADSWVGIIIANILTPLLRCQTERFWGGWTVRLSQNVFGRINTVLDSAARGVTVSRRGDGPVIVASETMSFRKRRTCYRIQFFLIFTIYYT
jgi:hypothetical protein